VLAGRQTARSSLQSWRTMALFPHPNVPDRCVHADTRKNSARVMQDVIPLSQCLWLTYQN
jgi:hypothetical protein